MPAWERLACARGAVPLARSSHSLTAFVEGSAAQLLLFGGEHAPRTPIDNVVHAYDLQTRAWTAHAPADGAPAPCARVGHAAAAAGGRLFVFGGREGVNERAPLEDLWSFAPASGAWQQVARAPGAPWPPARSYHQLASSGASASELYLFGGCGAVGRLNHLWRFDVRAGAWEQLPSSEAVKPRGGACLAVRGDAVLVVAGFCGTELDDAHVFDARSRAWRQLRPAGAPPARSVAALAPVGDALLLFGGELAPSAAGHAGAGNFCDAAFTLRPLGGDAEAAAWEQLAPSGEAPAPRGWAAAAALPQGLVVHGGVGADNARFDDMFLLTP